MNDSANAGQSDAPGASRMPTGQDEQVGVVQDGRERGQGVLEEQRHVEREPVQSFTASASRANELAVRPYAFTTAMPRTYSTAAVAHALLRLLVAAHRLHDALVRVSGELRRHRHDDGGDGGQPEAPVEHEQQHEQHRGRGGGGGEVGQGMGDERFDAAHSPRP